MNRSSALLCALPIVSLALSLAPTAQLPAAAQPSPSWQCTPRADLDAFQLSRGSVILNNFNLKEDTGIVSSKPYVELSFSASNRGSDAVFVSLQMIGTDETGSNVLAMSAEPVFGMVPENSTDQVTATANVEAGELATVVLLCMRVDGQF